MNYSVFQYRKSIFDRLKSRPELNYGEIMDAINEYQITTGHNIAVGKFLGIIDFIKEGNSITITNTDIGNIEINNKQQLIELIESSDFYNIVANSNFFETCFKE